MKFIRFFYVGSFNIGAQIPTMKLNSSFYRPSEQNNAFRPWSLYSGDKWCVNNVFPLHYSPTISSPIVLKCLVHLNNTAKFNKSKLPNAFNIFNHSTVESFIIISCPINIITIFKWWDNGVHITPTVRKKNSIKLSSLDTR